MTILITGCAGFIGHRLTLLLLNKGFNIVGIDNFDPFYDRKIKEFNLTRFMNHPGFTFIQADITNYHQLQTIFKEHNISFVIHLAAKAGVRPSVKTPSTYIQTNIVGTQNILDCLKKFAIKKYIFASSSSIYGNTKNVPFSENDCCNTPISPYAYSKKCGEMMNFTYHSLYNIDCINLRFFTVYGPGQRPDLAIHKFIHQIMQGQPIEMYGSGETARDYTYIDDITQGIYLTIQYLLQNHQVYEVINIGNHYPVKLKDLISTIEEVIGKKAIIKQKPQQAGEVSITYANIEKAERLIGYQPTTSLKEGISNFINWYHELYG
jgi:nucleoside-diphosphate-sugar epimerase